MASNSFNPGIVYNLYFTMISGERLRPKPRLSVQATAMFAARWTTAVR